MPNIIYSPENMASIVDDFASSSTHLSQSVERFRNGKTPSFGLFLIALTPFYNVAKQQTVAYADDLSAIFSALSQKVADAKNAMEEAEQSNLDRVGKLTSDLGDVDMSSTSTGNTADASATSTGGTIGGTGTTAGGGTGGGTGSAGGSTASGAAGSGDDEPKYETVEKGDIDTGPIADGAQQAIQDGWSVIGGSTIGGSTIGGYGSTDRGDAYADPSSGDSTYGSIGDTAGSSDVPADGHHGTDTDYDDGWGNDLSDGPVTLPEDRNEDDGSGIPNEWTDSADGRAPGGSIGIDVDGDGVDDYSIGMHDGVDLDSRVEYDDDGNARLDIGATHDTVGVGDKTGTFAIDLNGDGHADAAISLDPDQNTRIGFGEDEQGRYISVDFDNDDDYDMTYRLADGTIPSTSSADAETNAAWEQIAHTDPLGRSAEELRRLFAERDVIDWNAGDSDGDLIMPSPSPIPATPSTTAASNTARGGDSWIS